MKFSDFIKDKILSIILLLFGLITIEIFFMIYTLPIFIKIYTFLIITIMYLVGITYEYVRKKMYYKYVFNMLNELDDKYLISEIINTPSFTEGKILKDILMDICKSMHENVNKYKLNEIDYKEYIELWIHEVKIPIATTKMIIENNKSSVTKSISEEVDKIDSYIEQALYYARSNNVYKDYYIKKCKLSDIVNDSIKKNKVSLIENKVEIRVHNLDYSVNTDSKWIMFILNQITENSIKYKSSNSVLEFYGKKNKDNVILYIKDNGIGIKNSEIDRVFDKGFTGTNGRLDLKKSTGIGLYLCKKLCLKLGISINIESKVGKYTIVSLVFPNSSYTNLS